MRLSPSACAVKKTLREHDQLKPGDNVRVTLYDYAYSGKVSVTAVRRSMLSEESLQLCKVGISNYKGCEDTDNSRIPVGMNEQGKTVYLSPKHPDLKNQHILIMGDSGSGKSTAGNLLVLEKYHRGENVIYVDFSHSCGKQKMISHGFDVQFYEKNVTEIEMNVELDRDTLQLHLWNLRDDHRILVFRFRHYGEYVEDFLQQLYEQLSEDEEMTATVLIDEVHLLRFDKAGALYKFMETGRGNGISLITVLQAPHELKQTQLSCLNQASVKLIFGLNDRSDAEVCLKIMSVKPVSKFAETISELRKRECLVLGELEDDSGVLAPKRYVMVKTPDITV